MAEKTCSVCGYPLADGHKRNEVGNHVDRIVCVERLRADLARVTAERDAASTVMRAQRDELYREREIRVAAQEGMRALEAQTARVEKAERERDEARAQVAAHDADIAAIRDDWEIATAAIRDENAGLLRQIAALRGALGDVIAQMCGTPKSCGHDFICVCPGEAARAALASTVPDAQAWEREVRAQEMDSFARFLAEMHPQTVENAIHAAKNCAASIRAGDEPPAKCEACGGSGRDPRCADEGCRILGGHPCPDCNGKGTR